MVKITIIRNPIVIGKGIFEINRNNQMEIESIDEPMPIKIQYNLACFKCSGSKKKGEIIISAPTIDNKGE